MCVHVCVCVCVCVCACVASAAQLVRERIWRMETSGTFGSEVQVQDGYRRDSFTQGTHMQLPLSLYGVLFLSKQIQQVHSD